MYFAANKLNFFHFKLNITKALPVNADFALSRYAVQNGDFTVF